MKQTHERLTLEDIAKEIHISRTTIYKVIHQKGNVNEATRNTVMEALKRYNYVPNNNARNLAMNRRYRIAFLEGILTFTDKLIDVETANKIRRAIELTQLARISEGEKQQMVLTEEL